MYGTFDKCFDMDKLAVGCFILKVNMCENRQKQQKEAFSNFVGKPKK